MKLSELSNEDLVRHMLEAFGVVHASRTGERLAEEILRRMDLGVPEKAAELSFELSPEDKEEPTLFSEITP